MLDFAGAKYTDLITVTALTETVWSRSRRLHTVTFKVIMTRTWSTFELDHNLGKHGSLPSGVGMNCPEFKLYPNTDNPSVTNWAWKNEEAE